MGKIRNEIIDGEGIKEVLRNSIVYSMIMALIV